MNPNTQTSVQTRQPTVLDKVLTPTYIEGSSRQVPSHVKIDRIVTAFRACAMDKPGLLQCTPDSIRIAFIRCVQSGLIPDGRQAHLIPYNGVVKLQYDFKGIADLVRRSGEVKTIHCDVVYEADEFEFSFGDGQRLLHKPNTRTKNRGQIWEAYSYVILKDGTSDFEVLTVDEVNKVRDGSQGYQSAVRKKQTDNPWMLHWNEMAKKTAFKRHSKWLPLSADLKDKMIDDDDGPQESPIEVSSHIPRAKSSLVETVDNGNVTAEAPSNGPTDDPKQAADEPGEKEAVVTPPAKGKLSTETPESPQFKLQQAIEAAGFTFADLMAFGEQTGNIPDGSSHADWKEIPREIATRLSGPRALPVVLKALGEAKERLI